MAHLRPDCPFETPAEVSRPDRDLEKLLDVERVPTDRSSFMRLLDLASQMAVIALLMVVSCLLFGFSAHVFFNLGKIGWGLIP